MSVESNATLSWTGSSTTSTRNRATRGSALYVSSDWSVEGDSAVPWSGDGETSFIENTADYGGVLYTEYGAALSWRGKTAFESNHAVADGGGVGSAVPDAACRVSSLFIRGTTTFFDNTCGGNEVHWQSRVH